MKCALILQPHLRDQPLGHPWAGSLEGVGRRLVSDELWEAVEPLLPPEPPKPKGGRPRLSDRAALEGIAFVLATGTPWQEVSGSPGSPSGTTCWRRLKEWQRSGAWDAVHALLDSRTEETSR